jgi:hypothetical protein
VGRGAEFVAPDQIAPVPAENTTGEVFPALWRFVGVHPEWTADEGGEDGWEPEVAWWALATPAGLVVIDPLVGDWDELDRLVADNGGCAGIVRTCHWHQRSIADVSARYDAGVWAGPPPAGVEPLPLDHAVSDREELFGALTVLDVERDDEIGLWLHRQRALLFGDAMIRTSGGKLSVCPDSWTQPEGGSARLRSLLGALTSLPVEHVLVSHGPLVLGDGSSSLRAATG